MQDQQAHGPIFPISSLAAFDHAHSSLVAEQLLSGSLVPEPRRLLHRIALRSTGESSRLSQLR